MGSKRLVNLEQCTTYFICSIIRIPTISDVVISLYSFTLQTVYTYVCLQLTWTWGPTKESKCAQFWHFQSKEDSVNEQTHCRASSWGINKLRSGKGYVLLAAPTSATYVDEVSKRVDGKMQHEMQANSSPSPQSLWRHQYFFWDNRIKSRQKCFMVNPPNPISPATRYAECSWINGTRQHLSHHMDLCSTYMFVYTRTISAHHVYKQFQHLRCGHSYEAQYQHGCSQ